MVHCGAIVSKLLLCCIDNMIVMYILHVAHAHSNYFTASTNLDVHAWFSDAC